MKLFAKLIDPIELALGKYTENNPNKFLMEYMVQWVNTHDDVACRAMHEYSAVADSVFTNAYTAYKIAKEHGTTVSAMKEHERCVGYDDNDRRGKRR